MNDYYCPKYLFQHKQLTAKHSRGTFLASGKMIKMIRCYYSFARILEEKGSKMVCKADVYYPCFFFIGLTDVIQNRQKNNTKKPFYEMNSMFCITVT